jgi:hypothetical protein
MPEQPETPPPGELSEPFHPSVRWERKDASIGGVLLFGAILVIVAVTAHLVLWGMFRGMEKKEKAEQPALPPVAEKLPRFPQGIPDIPAPRLQVRDVDDMKALRQKEEAKLNSPPSWVDAKRGIVRIPIEEAMRLMQDPKIAAANGARTLPPKKKRL